MGERCLGFRDQALGTQRRHQPLIQQVNSNLF